MSAADIEQQQYIARMRLRSIEAGFERVAPFSAEFDCLMNNALSIKEDLDQLAIDLIHAKLREAKLEE